MRFAEVVINNMGRMFKISKNLKISGKTTDGKRVLKGAFIFMSTLGIPLETIFIKLDSDNMIIDWIDFCKSALNDGWNVNTLWNKLEIALVDTYGRDKKNIILNRLKKLYEKGLI